MAKHYGLKKKYEDGKWTPIKYSEHKWCHWWEYKDGSEGGELWLSYATKEVIDFDGAFDLPSYVKEELKSAGYKIGWE